MALELFRPNTALISVAHHATAWWKTNDRSPPLPDPSMRPYWKAHGDHAETMWQGFGLIGPVGKPGPPYLA